MIHVIYGARSNSYATIDCCQYTDGNYAGLLTACGGSLIPVQRTVQPQAAQSAAKNYCEAPQAVRSRAPE
jgi:hypothetical protein